VATFLPIHRASPECLQTGHGIQQTQCLVVTVHRWPSLSVSSFILTLWLQSKKAFDFFLAFCETLDLEQTSIKKTRSICFQRSDFQFLPPQAVRLQDYDRAFKLLGIPKT